LDPLARPQAIKRSCEPRRLPAVPSYCNEYPPGVMHHADALTYVVLDIPEPQASAVMSVRHAHKDLFRAALPVEITISDSIHPKQDPSQAFDALGRVAAETTPIQTSFGAPHRFPDSDTFVMRLVDDDPFVQLRERIVNTGIAFLRSEYAFVPHCTLRTRAPVSDEEARQLLGTEIPGEMTLNTLSVYTLARAPTPSGVSCQLRHRIQLAAGTA
jgi:2'-5' RNA ligase